MPTYTNTLIIQFDTELRPYEVPAFRGAVVAAIGNDVNLLFHNHMSEGFRYAYPLIQYKRIGGKAAIVCIGEGTEAIGQLFANMQLQMRIGETTVPMNISSVRPHRTLVQIWQTPFRYHLNRWIPLNEENYKNYTETNSLIERISLLEKILIGNILSFAKGVGVEIEHPLQCSIEKIEEPRIIKVKGNKVMAFDAEFSANVSLPDFIGLGKHSSFGYGIICQHHDRKTTQDKDCNQQT